MQFDTHAPIYLQIADYLCDLIIAGHYAEGERIPSVRDLAVELEVNPNTVVRSYAHLGEQDILENRRGIGYYVVPEAVGMIKRIRRAVFYQEKLPALIKTMKALQISIEDLVTAIGAYDETV
jgi:GntR family transcriptional regulator